MRVGSRHQLPARESTDYNASLSPAGFGESGGQREGDAHGAKDRAADFDQELLILFDAYVHSAIDRRGFLERARKFAVSGVTAAMLLDQLSLKFAEAQVISPDDKRLETKRVSYPSPQGNEKTSGYLVRPAKRTSWRSHRMRLRRWARRGTRAEESRGRHGEDRASSVSAGGRRRAHAGHHDA